GVFFFTSDDHETLVTRPRSFHDGALPAGSGVAAETLLRLAVHRDDETLRRAAHRALEALQPHVARSPSALASTLRAATLAEDGPIGIAIIGRPHDSRTRALLEVVRSRVIPRRVLAVSSGEDDVGDLPLLAGKRPPRGRSAAWVCRNYACDAPVEDPEALASLLPTIPPPPSI